MTPVVVPRDPRPPPEAGATSTELPALEPEAGSSSPMELELDLLQRMEDDDTTVPLVRNVHKRKRVTNERANLANDIVQLHARYVNQLEEETRKVPARREALEARVEAWKAQKQQLEADLARVEEWTRSRVPEEQAASRELRAKCFEVADALKAERTELLAEEEDIEKHRSGQHQTDYLLEAIVYLNNHHTLESDRLRLERRVRELREQQQQQPEADAAAARELEESRAKLVALRANIRTNTHAYTQHFFKELTRDAEVQAERERLNDPTRRYRCDDCGGELIEDNTSVACRECGVVASHGFSIDPSANMNFEQLCAMPSRQDAYRRLNHGREYLRQIQGRSRAALPNDLFEQLHDEFRKARIKQEDITPARVRAKLKKLRRSKYYEHCHSIAERMNPNYKPVQIDPAHEEKLCLMFVQLEEPFEKIKHLVKRDRKNFLSYPYVFFKLNELCGWDHYNRDCVLLKSVALLNRQDRFWALIMKQLGWENVGRTWQIHSNNA